MPMCLVCLRFNRESWADGFTCAAFPEGIPADIFGEYADHRLPYAGDHGIRFEAKDAAGADYVDELYGPVEVAEAAS